MRLRILNIRDVAEYQLCCGCGACAYISPDRVQMMDTLDVGRRPLVRGAERTNEAIEACPGVRLEHDFDPNDPGLIESLTAAWGPVLELWEGFASENELRFSGSSGGAATALALFCVELGGMHGTLHIAARKDIPYLNETVLSRTREQMLANTGSRYAPASPCDGLQKIEDAPSPCVFIGKPCDVAGAKKAAALRPRLAEKLGLTIGIFCAGTPSTRGTLEMMKAMGIADPSSVTSIRYRGNGWPGMAVVTERGTDGIEARYEMTYAESWGEILQKHRQWRCYICPDHTGEFADIAVGDPWYRPIPPGEPGRSLVVVRTERGKRILREAMAAGYLTLERVKPEVLPASQPNLLRTRGSVSGRLAVLRLLGAPVPRLKGIALFRFWRQLDLVEKVRSTIGTLRRIKSKRLRRRVPITPFVPPHS